MTLRINVFGVEIVTVVLDLEDLVATTGEAPRLTVVDKGVKKMSNLWVSRMNK
ncbi:hypothetical protein FDH96_gp141 [Mycobacterium phage Rey]|uniref:Uncharacterized protein n=1 Tax=Mycobacterium phage Rey TaxID=1034115 RepID=G1D5H8_9CAUD|nr:hypothetical protein FDH96_gp141 [Mycobacterium phage Rey]AEK10026.1 hypothetical protein PBI_REY_138 [Mycobacterium phage Rey]